MASRSRAGAIGLASALAWAPAAGGADFADRLDAQTRPLLGRPYLPSPLGEGEGEDPDPRFRLDAFDCTTFVETALALALAPSEAAAPDYLDRIRYRGPPRFEHRRHLATSQWIPGLIEDGWLEDVTAAVGGRATKQLRLRLDRRRWERRRVAKALVLPEPLVPEGVFPLSYIDLDTARRLAPDLPPGLVLNVVRADWAGSPDVVTHQGLLLCVGGRLVLRHASPVARRVVDEPLTRALDRYKKPRRWPVLGVHLLAPVGQAARSRGCPPIDSETAHPQ